MEKNCKGLISTPSNRKISGIYFRFWNYFLLLSITLGITRVVGSAEADFKIVSGIGEIVGDPGSNEKESYFHWKTACAKWKKDMKELNRNEEILALDCNLPIVIRQPSGIESYHSTGTYKLRVKVKNRPQ